MSIAARQERLLTIILGPHLSEKAHIAAGQNQAVFKVRTDASKKEIKQAVELMEEGVKVERVTVVNVRGKSKRSGRTMGRRANWKKAYVTFAEGSSVESILGIE
jgi:large subunit ribosomal protein L23